MSDCITKIRDKAGRDISDKEINQLLHDMEQAAAMRARNSGQSFESALDQIASETAAEMDTAKARAKHGVLLDIQARRRMEIFAERFDTPGEGLRAFMEGSSKKVKGARDSVDYQAKALYHKNIGRLVNTLEQEEVLQDFLKGDLDREVFIEIGELSREDGVSGSTGSPAAQKIARIIDSVSQDMISQQNRAGAYIPKLAGYITRQTHDRGAIRAVGGGSREKSLAVWSEFILPLIDPERTFLGEDPKKFLRNVHEGLYSGVHGEETGIADVIPTNLATKFYGKGARRVLHFKDALSAYEYNQRFGTKNLRDSIFTDFFFRSRNTTLLENFGPSGEANLGKAIREIEEKARQEDNSAELTDSLKDWRIQAAFNTVSGKNDVPHNFTFSRAMGVVKTLSTLSKMGATMISAITDKGFFQTEMAFQGISGLQTLGKQITLFAGQSGQEKQMLRMMGIGMEGLIGSTVSRYSMHTSVSGVAHKMQQKLFDINFMNWWTDTHKGAAAQLMSGHLGEHARMTLDELPGDLRDVLSLYNISRLDWDVMRSTAWASESGYNYITPDKLNEIPDDLIDKLIVAEDRTPSLPNRARMRDSLESKLRTYIADRTDIAVPTPGAAEKKYLTMNTQSGTVVGEAVRLLTMFKSFPVAVLNKVIARDVYGGGANSVKDWLLHDNKGKFRIMQTVAMATVLGYLSGAIRDVLKGRTPKELVTEGKVNFDVLHEAMLRGGGLGIFGDLLMQEYDGGRKSFVNALSGPVIGGMINPLAHVLSDARSGELGDAAQGAGKLTLDNTPFINLFYIRPVLDYIFLWNLQEMLSPGSLERSEKAAEDRHQSFFIRPSEQVNK